MNIIDIVIKYLEASEETKSEIDSILKDFQSPFAYPGEVSGTDQ